MPAFQAGMGEDFSREEGDLAERPSVGDTAVFTQQRRTSATLQAWAMQPRGVNGGSASKISLMEPMQPSFKCGSKPARNLRALAKSSGFTFNQASINGPMSQAHTVP